MPVVLATRNLRDLGGVVTVDGRRVRSGRLFRSGHLADATTDELAVLRGLGLRTVVDLRRDTEIAERPSPDLGAATIHISPNRSDNEFAVFAARLAEGDVDGVSVADVFPRGYRAMAVDAYPSSRFAEAVRALVTEHHQPALFHCTAGKDRTGWTAALLLTLLGVERDVVREDFVLTNEVRAPHNDTMVADRRRRLALEHGVAEDEVDRRALDGLRAMLEVEAAYLDAAFEAVDEVFGSFDRYRTDVLSIDDAAVAGFRRALLE